MSGMASYILSVTAAAILVSIVRQLSGAATVRLVSGLFMALVILAPLVKLELPDPEKWLREFQVEAQSAVSAGEEMAQDAAREIIKEETEAYILDKAASMGAVIEADVKLDDAGMPVSVKLRGEASGAAKARLRAWIREELGIGEGMQHWSE